LGICVRSAATLHLESPEANYSCSSSVPLRAPTLKSAPPIYIYMALAPLPPVNFGRLLLHSHSVISVLKLHFKMSDRYFGTEKLVGLRGAGFRC